MKYSIFNIAIIGLLLLGCSECNNLEVIESYYVNWREVEKASAESKGWLPPVLTNNAIHIREKHDLDTNKVWGSCKVNENYSYEENTFYMRNMEYENIFLNYNKCFTPNFSIKGKLTYFSSNDNYDETYIWHYAYCSKTSIIYFIRCRRQIETPGY